MAAPTRHMNWYFKDGSIIIQAEEKLYNLYREILCKHCEFFNVMLSLPQPGDANITGGDDISNSFRAAREKAKANGEDGSSDEKALVIPHTSQEFDYLLECIFWEFTTGERSVEHLSALLKLGEFYQAPKLVEYAIHSLEKHSMFSPLLRLHLAQSYGVHQWIEPAFRQLINIPLLSLSESDIAQLGLQVFALLARTHVRIVSHRQTCAIRTPPAVHDAGCMDPEDCEKAWKHAWWGEAARPGVAVALVHPDRRISGREILIKLKNIRPGWQMDDMCLELTIRRVEGTLDTPSKLLMEETFIQEAIEILKMT